MLDPKQIHISKVNSQNGHIHLRGIINTGDELNVPTFTVHDNHVYFENTDFFNFSIEDRVTLANAILGAYRNLSKKDCGLFSAALGVTENKNVYITYNSNEIDQTSKNCAEANLSNIMSLLTEGQEKFTCVYLMAGMNGYPQEAESPSELEDPILPCGRCSDILEAHCTQDTTLYALPANNGKTPLTLNILAKNLQEVGHGEAWGLSIKNILLRYKEITLDEHAAETQRTGWREMVENRRERAAQAEKKIDVKALLQQAMDEPGSLSDEEKRLVDIMHKALENSTQGRDSVPEIDADPTLAGINRHMVRQIHAANDCRPEDEERIIRCAVLRFADGTFASATEIIGKGENATPTAEFTAVSAHRLSSQPITDLWVTEARKEDIDAGKMHTSAKQSIERALKRCSQIKGTQDFAGEDAAGRISLHYIPFNNGKLTSEEVERIMFSPALEEAYPSMFMGSSYLKNGSNGHACCPGH